MRCAVDVIINRSYHGNLNSNVILRALWELKKQEERDTLFRDTEELKELRRQKMFGR